jgi:hypothetical protein
MMVRRDSPATGLAATAARPTLKGAALLLLTIAALWLGARPAQAAPSVCLAEGSGAGECSEPRGVATDFETGRLYVAERGNDRISVFEPDGEFVMAFGWDVNPGGGTGLETCTTASGCKAGSAGSGAGQLQNPTEIAVDNIAGSAGLHDVYVVTQDFRWSHFKADGSFLGATGWGVDTGTGALETCTTATTCQVGIKGGGECQLDNADVGNVSRIAIGPAGNVFLADTAGNEPNFTDRVEKFSPVGACLGETVLIEGNAILSALAIDSGEDAYVSVLRQGLGLRKYDLGAPKTQLCGGDLDPGIGTGALAIDAADRLYASQTEQRAAVLGAHRVITEYDGPACKILHRFAYGQVQTIAPHGLAVFHGPKGTGPAGDVWVSEESAGGIHYLAKPPLGPIVAPESVEATEIGNVRATIEAEVNPEAKETGVRVEYSTDPEFIDDVETTEVKTLTLPPGKEFRVQFAQFPLGCPTASKEAIENGECLVPETEYHYRVRATNADNPTGAGVATVTKTFETKEPLEIEDLFASEVGTDTATLSAVVNPLGIPATGHFEYVSDEDFKADVKDGGDGFEGPGTVKVPNPGAEAAIDFGSGEAGAKRSLALFPLSPGTTYHYRLAASDALIEGFRFSEVKTFATFAQEGAIPPCPNDALRIGASAQLPDCRAYEMVSPLDKSNGDIVVQQQLSNLQPAVLNQSAVSGERLTYGSYRAFGDAKSAPYTSQYLAQRNPLGDAEQGWQTHGISPPQTESINGVIEFDFEFRAFSEDLCEGWITPLFEPVLAPGGIAGVWNLYRRTELCDEEAEEYEAISTAAPENPATEYFLELQGVSEDGTVAAFASTDSLEGSGASPNPSGKTQLYVKGPGQGPRYACVLPGGSPAPECWAGTGTLQRPRLMRGANVIGALSADGMRVYWTDSENEGRIFLRQNPLAEGTECSEESSPCTIAVSKEGEEKSGTAKDSRFWAAAKDGSAAIYTTGKDLYRFEVEGQATSKIAGGVFGILGQSEDLSRTYFASSEVLSGEEANGEGAKAQAGKANLYLHEVGPGPGTYSFIGVLHPDDANQSAEGSSALAAAPNYHNGRVSADGLHAAFMSKARLTGYDNTDAKSGEPDTEVFVYDAAADGGAGEILCASCNPSGARPAGADISFLFAPIGAPTSPFWVAARLPVYSTNLHAPEVLADDGSRLIFESQDPLIPRDTNSRLDVYQWERAGTGGCKEESASFSTEAGGCIELISIGKSKRRSEIIDVSAGGDDVFFTTLSSLVPQDYGLVDIYDARVDGGFPVPSPPPPLCEGETCQSPPAAPELRTPASAAVGPGDPKAQKPKQAKKKRKANQRRRAKQRKARQRSQDRQRKTRNGRATR